MEVIGFLLYLVIVGTIAGYIARALVPGRQSLSFVETMVVGMVGSFIGGFLGYVLFGADGTDGALQASGIIGSIIGAIIALLVYVATRNRSGHATRSTLR